MLAFPRRKGEGKKETTHSITITKNVLLRKLRKYCLFQWFREPKKKEARRNAHKRSRSTLSNTSRVRYGGYLIRSDKQDTTVRGVALTPLLSLHRV